MTGNCQATLAAGTTFVCCYADAFADVIGEEEWNVSLADIMQWHADELKTLFPELLENIKDTLKIVAVEKQKYDESYENARKEAVKLLQKSFLSVTL